MNCALCKETRELNKSHIIPEFLYKPLYDEKHRAHVLSTAQRHSEPYIQKGYREKILCRFCENQFSGYEKYAAEEVFGHKLREMPMVYGDKLQRIGGIDYKLFKIFQLSILWRASVSQGRFFSQVNLGPHEERVRRLLRSGYPDISAKYPCVIISIHSDDRLIKDFIDCPEHIRVKGHHMYRFFFGGFFWLYFISRHDLPPFVKDLAISEEGTMKVYIGKKLEDIEYLTNFSVELNNKNRLPTPTEYRGKDS